MLKVSISFLRKETDAKGIPFLDTGDDVLYSPEAVREALAKRAQADRARKLTILGGVKDA